MGVGKGEGVKKRELKNLLSANSVPQLIAEWEFSSLENAYLKKKLTPIFNQIDDCIVDRKFYFIHMKAPLGSQIAVTFLKAAWISGFIHSYYVTPEYIAQKRAETWKNGSTYEKIMFADLLVIDNVVAQSDDFRRKALNEFVEQRVLNKRCTIFSSTSKIGSALAPNVVALLSRVGGKVIEENTSSKIKEPNV